MATRRATVALALLLIISTLGGFVTSATLAPVRIPPHAHVAPFDTLESRATDTMGWTNMFPAARPTFQSFARLAYDVNSDRTVVFGGNSIDAQETWSYDLDNNTWTNMRPATRPPGVDSPLVYDSQSDRFIHFGGLVWCENRECVTRSDETWAYNLESNTWTNMNPTSKPPRSFGSHAMAYDSQSDRVIWYSVFLEGPETWAYDFETNTWTDMNPAVSPTQGSSAMAYDSKSDRMILFGTDRNETWAYDFDGNRWTNLTPSDSPSLILEGVPAMAYDSESDRVILLDYATQVDAQGNTRFYPETWAYDLQRNTWTKMSQAAGPWELGQITYDSQSDRIILFGGGATFGYPWAYDFNANEWRNLHPTDWPELGGLTAYDSQSDRTVLFASGYTGAPVTETWSYHFNTNVWTNMRPSSMPSARSEAALAYDSQSDRIILFGGVRYDALGMVQSDETWAYDFETNTWTNMSPATGPSARHGHVMAYDSESDRIILFGGFGGNTETGPTLFDDTWAYDFNTNTWTAMRPSVSPPETLGSIVYDSQSDRVIFFGVKAGVRVPWTAATWVYDFNKNTWTNVPLSASPAARWAHAMAYDSKADRVILFGGIAQGVVNHETWAYNLNANAWTNLSPIIFPSAAYGAAMTYDSESDRVILYLQNGDGQTWAFDFGAQASPTITPVWVVYATVAVAGATIAAVASVLLWRRQRRSRVPPAPPPGAGP